MRRSLAPVATLLLAASCAHTGAAVIPPTSAAPSTTTLYDPTAHMSDVHLTSDDRAASTTIDAAPAAAFSKLAAVYADIGLTVNTFVDASRQLAANGVRARGHLGKLRISQLLECGAEVTGEDRANSYEMTLYVSSTVQPAPNGKSVLSTLVTATGRPMSSSGDAVRCATTGALERRIATLLTLKVAAAP